MALAANIRFHEACLFAIRRSLGSGMPAICQLIELAARCAWSRHPGRFADGALENVLLDMGRHLPQTDTAALAGADAERGLTLHVASEVYPTGGHSRVLTTWMEQDMGAQQVLVLTRQREPIPGFLHDRWRRANAHVIVFDPETPHAERAAELRALSRSASRIFLHQHPDDVVPVLAYAENKTAPVIMFNHAHFWFSMGTTVADLVVNTLPYYGELSIRRRAARRVELLTGGPEPVGTDVVDKVAAKRDLGLPPHSPVVLTMGHERYYEPRNGSSFFSVAIRLLRERTDIHLLIVGVVAGSALVPAELRAHPRAKFYGLVSDPVPYYRAADIFLESFPMPSLGAAWQACSIGEAYPVLSFTDAETIIRPAIPLWPARTCCLEDYLEQIVSLLSNVEQTRNAARQMRLVEARATGVLGDELAGFHRIAAEKPPAASRIPVMAGRTDRDDYIVASMSMHPLPVDEFIRAIPRPWVRLMFWSRAALSGQFRTRTVLGGFWRILKWTCRPIN